MNSIPVTVLTGFLGSGKSTLLRHVLTEAHGMKIAVIENEFGKESIDNEIIVSGSSEQITVLSNGCICCSIIDDLRSALVKLSEKQKSGEIKFERVVIETTGLSNPGPIAQTLFLDEYISLHYRLDAILTMVDAKHAMEQLNERLEAQRQVGFADHIFISKTDLVEKNTIDELSSRLKKINPKAPQFFVRFGNIPLTSVFNIEGFSPNSRLSIEDIDHNSSSQHDVKSIVFCSEHPLHGKRFSQLMNALIKSYGSKLLRYKGVLNIYGEHQKIILQGVHHLMNYDIGEQWTNDEARTSKIVFIGIELPKNIILDTLQKCLVYK